jgi:hypothetical protein
VLAIDVSNEYWVLMMGASGAGGVNVIDRYY